MFKKSLLILSLLAFTAISCKKSQDESAQAQAAQDESAQALLGKACLRDADCGHNGFCDSALNYQCSTCTQNADCETFNQNNDGYEYVCRGDGRCSPTVFETVWKIPKDKLRLVLPIVEKDDCDLEVDWGDKGKFEKVACGELKHSCIFSREIVTHSRVKS